jgi:hypothetical protein
MPSTHPEAHPEGLATGEVADRDDVDEERRRADNVELPPMEGDETPDSSSD